ncbi:hypothetical protein OJF2_55450 [Aquisphaera giovannonii]|uniref:PilZ domain-containing protein n=1 Tax=Aquisphaera giovannonii TaxID=406548 RepID=A0A5B9WAP9_9BACT|nr:hypothetical protein [Aquisphaera giovannonii]QEH36960.1 hypothetical protein OJF2_55450 [Aquisphaera giovannonii]
MVWTAEVLDISQSGMSLLCVQMPPGNRGLWVATAGSAAAWSKVILKSFSQPHPGRFVLRLAFAEGCPYDLFRIAVVQPARQSSPVGGEAATGRSQSMGGELLGPNGSVTGA